MPIVLRCGQSTRTFKFAENRSIERFKGLPEARERENPIVHAFERPTDAPFLRQGLVPGDHVVIAFDARLQRPESILVPVIEEFVNSGIQIANVSIVLTSGGINAEQLKQGLPERFSKVEVLNFDLNDAKQLAYLASTSDGRRVYLSRAIVDADYTLLVGEIASDLMLGLRSPSTALYPELADLPAVERSRLLGMETRTAGVSHRQHHAVEEPVWLSGIMFGVGIVPDRDGHVAMAWFGSLAAIEQKGIEWLTEHMHAEPPAKTPDIAVISLYGDVHRWEDVIAGLVAAVRAVPECTEFAVVSELSEPPGPGIRSLADREQLDPTTRLRRSHQGKWPDAVAAVHLSEILANAKVYLISRLPADVVESLGIVPVATINELQNLLRRFERPWIMEDANRVWVAK